MTDLAERSSWLRLAGIKGIGETVRCGLIKEFKTPERIFRASISDISQVPGWTAESLEKFRNGLKEGKLLCQPETLEAEGINIISFNDPEYPESLRHIPDAPVVLFALGKPEIDARPHLAVVGARKGSQQGYDIAREFSYELSKAGFVIVSGLALGIDTFAHKGALEASGKTVAVLGCGVDVVYPPSNHRIREKIPEKGLIVSEFPPGTEPRPWHFPIRNRIISGMSVGILVVEASSQSGSLITARLGIDQDRDVFAIPGGIRSKLSEGTLALINEGACMVTSPDEIINHYRHLLPVKNEEPEKNLSLEDFTPDELELLEMLAGEPTGVEDLLSKMTWEREKLFSVLLNLEIRDILIKYPGNLFQSKINRHTGR
ncbi:MAG: DNA-protecting protein DprA [Candidatus Riflebacteria bacterium]|nr:DNA-protecting protein DprA [Candidatus Riflebacteria bacterium]